MIFTRRRLQFSHKDCNAVIEHEAEARFLGDIVDDKLNWPLHKIMI